MIVRELRALCLWPVAGIRASSVAVACLFDCGMEYFMAWVVEQRQVPSSCRFCFRTCQTNAGDFLSTQ